MSIVSLTDKIKFIEKVFGKGPPPSRSNNFEVRCPLCAPIDKTKKKLSIQLENDLWQCWSCGKSGRSLAPLIRKFGTREQLYEYCNHISIDKSNVVTGDKKQLIEQTVNLPKDFMLLVEAPRHDPNVKAIINYVTSRELNEDDMWYFKLGYSSELRWSRRVIIPSFDCDGILNFFTARAIDHEKKKYDNLEINCTNVIFNELNIDWSEELVVCEGPFDLMKCPNNSVSMLGSNMHEHNLLFQKITKNYTPVALSLDADMWETKTLRLSEKLREYDIDVRIVDTRVMSDPGNATKEEFSEALSVAKNSSWEDSFKTRLQKASRTSMKV